MKKKKKYLPSVAFLLFCCQLCRRFLQTMMQTKMVFYRLSHIENQLRRQTFFIIIFGIKKSGLRITFSNNTHFFVYIYLIDHITIIFCSTNIAPLFFYRSKTIQKKHSKLNNLSTSAVIIVQQTTNSR